MSRDGDLERLSSFLFLWGLGISDSGLGVILRLEDDLPLLSGVGGGGGSMPSLAAGELLRFLDGGVEVTWGGLLT